MQLHQWHLKRSLSCISYVHRIRVSGFLMRCASCSYSLITVTSSYRIFTCFPFTLRIQAHISHAKWLYMTGTNDLLYETFYILAYCAFIYNAKITSFPF